MSEASPILEPTSVVSIRGVSKRFKSKLVLDDISFEIAPGKVFALLGENGAGKTTLIKILTGFLKPDSGNAQVLAHDCSHDSVSIRREIGYVSDSPALYEWMTAPEIGWFTSAFYDEGFDVRYERMLREFRVPKDTKIGSMSKGQRAKVALALATAHDPRLLILDEPTSGLDPIVRRQFLESMVDRAAEGRTVLLSSHHINEVERVADDVAMIHDGQLKLVRPLEDLKHRTRIITATMDDAHVESPRLNGEILSASIHGRQRRWVVTNLSSDWRTDFSEEEGVRQVDETTPSLEEIFIAVCDQPKNPAEV